MFAFGLSSLAGRDHRSSLIRFILCISLTLNVCCYLFSADKLAVVPVQ